MREQGEAEIHGEHGEAESHGEHGEAEIHGEHGEAESQEQQKSIHGEEVQEEEEAERHGAMQAQEKRIRSFCKQGQLSKAVEALFSSSSPSSSPSHTTYICLLRACTSLGSLPHTHHVLAHLHLYNNSSGGNSINTTRSSLYLLIGSYLVVALAKCGAPCDALHVSHRLPSSHRSVFSWTSIISSCADLGCCHESLQMYKCMLQDGFQPNAHTYASLFKACGILEDLSQGIAMHADAVAKGILCSGDLFACNSLLSMYGKCGRIDDAEGVFRVLPRRNVVSWSALLSVYAEREDLAPKALCLYRQMREEGVEPNAHTFVVVLQACCALLAIANVGYDNTRALFDVDIAVNANANANQDKKPSMSMAVMEIVQGVHSYALQKGYASDAFVGTCLIAAYGKCGEVRYSEHVFIGASIAHHHDVVVWNAMLSVYTERGHGREALLLYREMVMKHAKEGNFHINGLSFVIALEACSLVTKTEEEEGWFSRKDQVSIDIVRAIHSDIANTRYASDVMVMTALVCMHGKCGDFLEAEYIFFSSLEPNIVSWTVMLSLYTAGGESENALWLYQHMLSKEVGMSDMTLVCVLQACSGTGSLGLSQEIHFSLTSAGYDTITFVSPTLIHAYGSCARMPDAQALFYSIPRPSLEAWNACIRDGDILKSIRMFERLNLDGIDPDGVTFVALLSACSHGGLVTDGHRYFELMNKNHGIRPDIKHYGCLVDLVGRAGNIEKAYSFLMRMLKEADFTTWLSVLGACCVHGNCIEVATEAFKKVVSIEPEHGVAYILMSNAYVLE